MPLLLIALLFALMMTLAPPVSAPLSLAAAPAGRPAPEYHYTRGGIVEINPVTGATRFKPYRVAGHLDRRGPLRAA